MSVLITTKGMSNAYLVPANVEFSLASLHIALEKHGAHLEDLLHDSILSEVILALERSTNGTPAVRSLKSRVFDIRGQHLKSNLPFYHMEFRRELLHVNNTVLRNSPHHVRFGN